MKPLKSTLILYRSTKFRNLSMLLGLVVSMFLVASLRSTTSDSDQQTSVGVADGAQQTFISENVKSENASLLKESSTKYHNFLASYFLQESSVERTKKKTEEKSNIFGHIKDFRQIIASRDWSLF